jgi:hypothetical protein
MLRHFFVSKSNAAESICPWLSAAFCLISGLRSITFICEAFLRQLGTWEFPLIVFQFPWQLAQLLARKSAFFLYIFSVTKWMPLCSRCDFIWQLHALITIALDQCQRRRHLAPRCVICFLLCDNCCAGENRTTRLYHSPIYCRCWAMDVIGDESFLKRFRCFSAGKMFMRLVLTHVNIGAQGECE